MLFILFVRCWYVYIPRIVREAPRSGRLHRVEQIISYNYSQKYSKVFAYFVVVIYCICCRMTAAEKNEARRFITLIDILYEHKVKLVS